MNLPIALTLGRIVLVPLIIVFLISSSRVHVFIAALIFIAASLTDWLDGRMARRWNQVTRLGTLLDPIADKLLVAAALVALVIIALGHATVRRNEDYRTALAIHRDTVAKRPDNPRARNNLGIELNRRGETDEAERHFAEAVRLRPDIAEARANLGAALLHRGVVDQAVVHLSEAVRLKDGLGEARYHLGLALLRQGDIQGALVEFSRAGEILAEGADPRRALIAALGRAGRAEDAMAELAELVRLEPGSAGARYLLGNALYRHGRIEEAIAQDWPLPPLPEE